MRERIRDKERLEHIVRFSAMIMADQEKYGLDTIMESSIMYHGMVKYVENIGEATYMLTKEFRAEHPEVPWEDMEDMRHVLVHGYYQIKPQLLRRVVERDIPALIPLVQALYDEEIKNNQ